MSTINIAEIYRLSVDERVHLVREILNSLATEAEPVSPNPAVVAEIQRRLEAHRRDPSRVVSMEEALAGLERDFG